MKKLLVYCYFCPNETHRPGGVQQVVGPLIEALKDYENWDVDVFHPGGCNQTTHFYFEEKKSTVPDFADPANLSQLADKFRRLARSYDVVLSIDTTLPCNVYKPQVLMSNTLCYRTEALPVQVGRWSKIIVPSVDYQKYVQSITGNHSVQTVHYGLPEEILEYALSTPAVTKIEDNSIIRLPHRPDRRKGHKEAILGLAKARKKSKTLQLKISWLDNGVDSRKYKRELEKFARTVGVDHQVTFEEWVDGGQKYDKVIESIAALQIGTFQETFGLSIIESLLFGRPAVVRSQPAVAEIAGFMPSLIQTSNPLTWYKSLDRYFNQINDQSPESDLRLKLAQSLSITRMASDYDHVLSDAKRYP